MVCGFDSHYMHLPITNMVAPVLDRKRHEDNRGNTSHYIHLLITNMVALALDRKRHEVNRGNTLLGEVYSTCR